jgi:hypothetical protein
VSLSYPAIVEARRIKAPAKAELIIPDGPLVRGHTYTLTFPKSWKMYASFNGEPVRSDSGHVLMLNVESHGILKIYRVMPQKDTVLIMERDVYSKNPEFYVSIAGTGAGRMIDKKYLVAGASIQAEIINNDISLAPFPIIQYRVKYYKNGQLEEREIKGKEIPESLLREFSSLSNSILVFFIRIEQGGKPIDLPPVPVFI